MPGGSEPEVDIQLEVVKEKHSTEQYTCGENRLTELLRTKWKHLTVLVTGAVGCGKSSLLIRVARKLSEGGGCSVRTFESFREFKEETRHFETTHNHEFLLVDNVKPLQFEPTETHSQNQTVIMFSRSLATDSFDCVVNISGSHQQVLKVPFAHGSLWNDHIKTLCFIPFLFVLSKSLIIRKNMPGHEIYLLLLCSYVNYCQYLRVSLFNSIYEVPETVEQFIKCMAQVSFNNNKFVDQVLKTWCCVPEGDMGVVTKTKHGNWRFTFEGMEYCLGAFKLYWDKEEDFCKDTGIQIPSEAMKLFKEMRTDSRSALLTRDILDIDITLQPVGGEVVPGGSLSLVCSASVLGPPGKTHPTFQWFKDRKPLLGEVLNKLIIEEASDKDCGEYVCYVADFHDKVNKVSKEVHVSVKSTHLSSAVTKSIINEKYSEPLPATADYKVVLKELDTQIKDHVDLTSLLPYLMKYQLLSESDQYILSSNFLTPSDRAERLLMSIKKNGQNGYDKFVSCLEEEREHTGHHHLLTLINRRGVSKHYKSSDARSKPSSSSRAGGNTRSPITLTIEPEPLVEVNKGDNAIIMCGATGTAPLRFEWYKDERCVGRDQVLELKYLDEEDVGHYHCKITDGRDIIWTNPTLLKLKPPEPASLKRDLELTDRMLSELAAQLSHIGDKWEKLGFYLNVDQNTIARIRYEQRNTLSKIYQLLRRWRDRTPDASYSQLEQSIRWIGVSLQQPTPAGAASLYGSMNVHKTSFGFESPIVLSNPHDQIGVLEGGPVTLEITAKGATPLMYQWFFNNQPLQGATRPHFYINSSTTADTGDYHCQVKNMCGVTQSTTARVYISTGTTYASKFLISRNPDIKYPPSALGLSNPPSLVEGSQSTPVSLDKSLKSVMDPSEKQLFSLPPNEPSFDNKVVILEHPQGGSYQVGSQVTLRCQAEGTPPIQFRWELNNMSLTHERKPLLFIPQVTLDDEGWYRCAVTNKYGRTYTNSCKVIVRNAQ